MGIDKSTKHLGLSRTRVSVSAQISYTLTLCHEMFATATQTFRADARAQTSVLYGRRTSNRKIDAKCVEL
jgi:hypothetical protein